MTAQPIIIKPSAALWINRKKFRDGFNIDICGGIINIICPKKPRFLFKKDSLLSIEGFVPPFRIYKLELNAKFSNICTSWRYGSHDYWIEFKYSGDPVGKYITFETEEALFKHLQRENYNDC